jgi:hypothetical protein
VRIVDALGDDAQISHALRSTDFRLQPPNNAKYVIAERGHSVFGLVVVDRCSWLRGWIGKIEPGGHNSDNDERLGVQVDRLIQDDRGPAEATLPQAPAQ